MSSDLPKPLIGITCDLVDDQVRLRRTYLRAIVASGGTAVAIPPLSGTAAEALKGLHGLVMSGGDDPDTRPFGEAIHPEAKLVDPDRQAFEIELLDHLAARDPDLPILGVCLGMQLIGLHSGGRLDQHLPETLESADRHWNGVLHDVEGPGFTGRVYSHHRQALASAGGLDVIATAPDGVIEAVRCPVRHHVEGVQWHPERTTDDNVGIEVFRRLIEAARVRNR